MFRSVAAFVILSFAAPQALAGPEAEAIIERAVDRFEAGRFDVTNLRETVDVRRIARFTLGRHAHGFSEDDIDRYTEAFERFLIRTLNQEAGRFEGADIRVSGSIDRAPADSIVITEVNVSGAAPETVRWRVLERDGDWKVVDVEAFGLWLAIEQRAQVAAILDRRRADIEAVIDALEPGRNRLAERAS